MSKEESDVEIDSLGIDFDPNLNAEKATFTSTKKAAIYEELEELEDVANKAVDF
jgi:hypothetical protein